MDDDSERFQAWANKGHWSNWERKPERGNLLVTLVKSACDLLPEGDWVTTSKLVESILPGLDSIGKGYVSNGLAYVRKHGMLDGYWFQGQKNPHTFGHPTVKWKRPHGVEANNQWDATVGLLIEDEDDGTEGLAL